MQPDGRACARELAGDGLEKQWKALADTNAATAYQAMWALIASEKTSLPYLKTHLQPVDPAVMKQIPRWIRALDDEEFAVREKATTDLENVDELATPAFRQALKDRPSPEVARRVQELLDKGDAPVPHVRRLREIRAVAALEQMSSPEARKVLQELAKGLPEARLTQEAKASLDRLAKGRAGSP
jgi:hypothetical protein